MTNVKSETLKGVKWSAVEKITFQGLQFLIGLILARLLSPEDFGVIGMITIFIALSQSIIDSGFANALIRKKDRTQEDYSTVFYFNIIVGIICYCILFFSAPWIADFFNTPILKPVTRVVAVNLFISSLTIVQVAQFQINIDFKSLAKVTARRIVWWLFRYHSSLSGIWCMGIGWPNCWWWISEDGLNLLCFKVASEQSFFQEVIS